MAATETLSFAESGTFEANLRQFEAYLASLDAVLGPVFSSALSKIADRDSDRAKFLDQLLSTLVAHATNAAPTAQTVAVPSAATTSPTVEPLLRRLHCRPRRPQSDGFSKSWRSRAFEESTTKKHR